MCSSAKEPWGTLKEKILAYAIWKKKSAHTQTKKVELLLSLSLILLITHVTGDGLQGRCGVWIDGAHTPSTCLPNAVDWFLSCIPVPLSPWAILIVACR